MTFAYLVFQQLQHGERTIVTSRRTFMQLSAATATAFIGLGRWADVVHASPKLRNNSTDSRYGPLLPDPAGLVDLPRGFSYQIISRAGDRMDDGWIVPGLPDGMGAFAAASGNTVLVRNHELYPNQLPGPFGVNAAEFLKASASKLYDQGSDKTPHHGGTTTLVYDTDRQKVVRQFLSLAGTARNCAGGPTPWNTWITCEETTVRAGYNAEEKCFCDRDHGYNFEVPASDRVQLHQAAPLVEMGRFNHEAVAVDPLTSIVYQTEDREDGMIYRYIPNEPGKLAMGGKLQALCIAGRNSCDTRNWNKSDAISLSEKLRVSWLDLIDVQSPADDLRYRGYDAGAARFARGEGMWYADGYVYFACTNGGINKQGQIWRYKCAHGNGDGELMLFVEPNNSQLLESADNMTAAPWGDLIVCEDRQGDVVRLIGVSKEGRLYTLANSHAESEFAGVCFSPDGSTLFVNIQHQGITLAITGPWK